MSNPMILLITPPLSGLNTPYPATTMLTAYLNSLSIHASQCDMGIELINRLFSRNFLEGLFAVAFESEHLTKRAMQILSRKDAYLSTIDATMRFLRGEDDTLATRIASRQMLPEGPRLSRADDQELEWAFGVASSHDRAKHLATLYIEDLADLITDVAASDFSLIRYGEQLAVSAATFDPLEKELTRPLNMVEQLMIELLDEHIARHNPTLVGFTIPFPGSLLAALRCAEHLKSRGIKTVLGGGYINTELRQMSDSRIFKYIDYLIYDDGELPLWRLIQHLAGEIEIDKLVRTRYLEPDGTVSPLLDSSENIPFGELPSPVFDGLPLQSYLSTIELTNPMHKLWSDGRWNKMTVAHGCYWAKCTFCDTSLDYICRYEAPSAEVVVDRMEDIMRQTKISGFHFTDEALPPKLLKQISQEIIRRSLTVSFWGNIRFEKSFDADSCRLLAQAGCIAVSGGIEVASPRVLKLINKGITIESLKSTLEAFADAGVMVHGYLMYGFPSQTFVESLASLEVVRGLFAEGLIQSAFWHRYAMTIHSPTGMRPADFGVERTDKGANPFANNEVEYYTNSDVDWEAVGKGLHKATYNYMHARCLDRPAKSWFKR